MLQLREWTVTVWSRPTLDIARKGEPAVKGSYVVVASTEIQARGKAVRLHLSKFLVDAERVVAIESEGMGRIGVAV